MRTHTDTGKTDCLSIRIEEVPGLNHSLIAQVHKILDDKSIGIKNDRRYFLSSVPGEGTQIIKVNFTPIIMWLNFGNQTTLSYLTLFSYICTHFKTLQIVLVAYVSG